MKAINNNILVAQIFYIGAIEALRVIVLRCRGSDKDYIYEWVRRFAGFCVTIYVISKFWLHYVVHDFSLEKAAFMVLAIMYFYLGAFASAKRGSLDQEKILWPRIALSTVYFFAITLGLIVIDKLGLSYLSAALSIGLVISFLICGLLLTKPV